jgi:tetratricopeptide (TPR) repeat protein
MQEIIRRRHESGFVGRQTLLARFQENLQLAADDPRHRFLVHVRGDPGSGKSFLVRQLEREARDLGAVAAVVDDRVFDVPGAMAAIAAQLRRQNVRLRAFERRHQRYLERMAALMAEAPGLSGASLLLARLAVRLGLRAVGTVPVVGVVAEAVDPNAVVEQADHLHTLLTRVLRSRDDARLVLAPTDELSPPFVQDLRQVARRRPVALFFDGYERTAPLLDAWVFDLVRDGGPYGDLPANLTITISGQEPLDPHRWAELLTEIEPLEIGRFTDAEARQLLAGKSVRDDAVVEAILAVSGRLPLLVATLAEGSPIDAAALAEPGGDVVDHFLRWLADDRRREVALAAALPRQVDEDALAVLAGADGAPELYGWLRNLPFVQERDGACSYHQLVRAPMLRLQRERSALRWRERHRALAEHNLRCREELGLTETQGWADPGWQRHLVEETYHRLCATPMAALPAALAGALVAYRSARPLGRRWAEMLHAAGADAGAPAVAGWGTRLLAATGGDEDCWPAFVTALLDRAPLQPSERALALGQRAECHALNRRFDAALADFERALVLDPGNPALAVSRGQTLRIMGRFEDALRDLDRAIELAPDSETAVASRGVILRRLGRFDDAVADLTRAIELRPDDDWAIAHRGETYRMMGHHRLAVADFTEAIRLDPGYAFAHVSRALARRRLGHRHEELADLDRALQLAPGYEFAWAQRAITHRRAGRLDRSLADLTRAVELDPEYAWALANRAVTLRQLGRYDDALADLDRALRLEPADAWALANRGVTLRQVGRYDTALVDLSSAVALQPASAWTVANRGETLRGLGRDLEALADLDRAVDLEPGSAWTLARRGEVRRRLGDAAGAREDFDRALRLDPDEGAARFGRALLLIAGGRPHEAAAELESAVSAGRRSLEVRPGDPAGLLRLAVYEAASGRAEEAPALCREALRQGAAGGLVETAVRDLRELAALTPGDGAVIRRVVEVLDPPAAAKEIEAGAG